MSLNFAIPEHLAAPATPIGITGSQNTSRAVAKRGQSANRGLIDWCAFTVPIEPVDGQDALELAHEVVKYVLGLDPALFVALPYGRRRYSRAIAYGNIEVWFDGSVKGMGVHVDMSGTGCRQWEGLRGDAASWRSLIYDVRSTGGRFTRLDLAIDDRRGLVSLVRVRRHLRTASRQVKRNGVLVSTARWRSEFGTTNVYTKHNAQTGVLEGHGVTFGVRRSLIYVRFYDKALEQRVDGHWVRVELELKGQRADMAAGLLLESEVGSVAAGVLSRYLNFVDESEDLNFCRWPVSAWWSKFLGDCEQVRLTTAPPPPSLERTERWVERAVSSSLAAIWVGSHAWDIASMMNYLLDRLDYGVRRLSPRHWQAINAARPGASGIKGLSDRRESYQAERSRAVLSSVLSRDELIEERRALVAFQAGNWAQYQAR